MITELKAPDPFGRRITYLRLSLTDACNFRCVYCMPEDMTFRPGSELLRDDEIFRLVRLFARLGFEKIRLTGGEPALRENLTGIVSGIAGTPGVREVALTTNGTRLAELARPLVRAGLRRINIRLDTLDPAKFWGMSRGGGLDDVWMGILAADAAGLAIKLNAVVVRGRNDREDAAELARLTFSRPWEVRFLELMPIGRLADFQREHLVPEKELRETLQAAFGPLRPVRGPPSSGPARRYRFDGAVGTVGFISSVTNPFCGGCARARLTADGRFRLCLLRENQTDLLTPLRNGAGDAELLELIRNSLRFKPREHGLAENVIAGNRVMSEIGG